MTVCTLRLLVRDSLVVDTGGEKVAVERVRRLGSGKADYRWAKDTAVRRAAVSN